MGRFIYERGGHTKFVPVNVYECGHVNVDKAKPVRL